MMTFDPTVPRQHWSKPELLGYIRALEDKERDITAALLRYREEEFKRRLMLVADARHLINTLLPDGRYRAVLTMRWLEGKTLLETGEQLGISRERVRQIETRGIRYAARSSKIEKLFGIEVDLHQTVEAELHSEALLKQGNARQLLQQAIEETS